MDFTTYRKKIEYLSRSITDNIVLIFRPILDHYGITYLQYQILYQIKAYEPCPIGNLAKLVRMENGNTSATCKKLEMAGLLIRSRSEKDERVVNLSLTPQGNQMVSDISATLDQKYRTYWQQASEQEDMASNIEALEKTNSFTQKLLDLDRS